MILPGGHDVPTGIPDETVFIHYFIWYSSFWFVSDRLYFVYIYTRVKPINRAKIARGLDSSIFSINAPTTPSSVFDGLIIISSKQCLRFHRWTDFAIKIIIIMCAQSENAIFARVAAAKPYNLRLFVSLRRSTVFQRVAGRPFSPRIEWQNASYTNVFAVSFPGHISCYFCDAYTRI